MLTKNEERDVGQIEIQAPRTFQFSFCFIILLYQKLPEIGAIAGAWKFSVEKQSIQWNKFYRNMISFIQQIFF